VLGRHLLGGPHERARQPPGDVLIDREHELGLRLVALNDAWARLEIVQRPTDRRLADPARQRVGAQRFDESGKFKALDRGLNRFR
jgi:hypothetical protein